MVPLRVATACSEEEIIIPRQPRHVAQDALRWRTANSHSARGHTTFILLASMPEQYLKIGEDEVKVPVMQINTPEMPVIWHLCALDAGKDAKKFNGSSTSRLLWSNNTQTWYSAFAWYQASEAARQGLLPERGRGFLKVAHQKLVVLWIRGKEAGASLASR